MNLTLCDKDNKGDIPSWEFSDGKEAIMLTEKWLMAKDFDESVFVCFPRWGEECFLKRRCEHDSILVSHCLDAILDMANAYLVGFTTADFFIFEFESYEEAFNYCIDLKEGF